MGTLRFWPARLHRIVHKSLGICEQCRLDSDVFMDRERKKQLPVIREDSNASKGSMAAALFLAAMLQWAGVLAVYPRVHELIHHDADNEHHDCAVTLFLSGQVEQSTVDPISITRPALVQMAIDQDYETQSLGSFFLNCRILEHAPPLLS